MGPATKTWDYCSYRDGIQSWFHQIGWKITELQTVKYDQFLTFLKLFLDFWFLPMCRVCKFFDVFRISLSMNVLICLTLDRFYSIFFPLYAMRARKSVQLMVLIAWTVSLVTSAPQLYLFKTAPHPCFEWYTQCVSKNFIGEMSNEVSQREGRYRLIMDLFRRSSTSRSSI